MDSVSLFRALTELIPGGVNSPFRAFGQVGGDPPLLVRGQGSRVWDLEGREYLDLVCGWGPLLMGHCHPRIVQAVQQAAAEGTLFGSSTTWELDLARLVTEAFPSIEMVRFVNSGAEAVQSALRVARSAMGRPRILKFEGCYHGHVECLDAAGLEAEQAGGPLALGASPGAAAETLVARFNDLESVAHLLASHPGEVAAVLVEPVTGSMGVIPPKPGFLEGLRELCDREGVLLIFDEVLTGFRVARGGAQERYGVRADLTCLGKALSGGLPMGGYGGRADLMRQVAPTGPVYQAGTYCGNPVSVRAAVAAMELAAAPGVYEDLEALASRLVAGLSEIPGLLVQNVGSMFSLGFGPERLEDHRDAARLQTRTFALFFHEMLARGVYLPPSTFDAACLATVHTAEEVDQVIQAAAEAVPVALERTPGTKAGI
ncbi:MAG: aspartate aminotransferase family protein [Candidatus Xenobium sp.]|jgi:glutamate-1-semialdehyde 2,1-aminomutase|nr:glutamate-1-semialdehyde 2,1-aminomutase [Burkholderiales bacterium]